MQNNDPLKKICRKCGGMGHFLSYEAPHVKRKYCDCETAKIRKEFITKQIKTKDDDPIWELFII